MLAKETQFGYRKQKRKWGKGAFLWAGREDSEGLKWVLSHGQSGGTQLSDWEWSELLLAPETRHFYPFKYLENLLFNIPLNCHKPRFGLYVNRKHCSRNHLNRGRTSLTRSWNAGIKRQFMTFGSWCRQHWKDVVRLCTEKMRRDKAQLELNLATIIKDNKKGFYKHISNKRRAKENLRPWLESGGKPWWLRMRKRLGDFISSLPQSSIIRTIVLQVPSSLTGTGPSQDS